MTFEQFFEIKMARARNLRKKQFKDSTLASDKAAIEKVMGYHYGFKLRLIGALRRELSYEDTIKYIEEKQD